MRSACALSLGANIGDRAANLRAAVRMIEIVVGSVTAKSDIFETPPWGDEDQPAFLNACIIVETTLDPHALLVALKEIEREIGRAPSRRWGPRAIDIDILTYGDIEISHPDLTIPHMNMHERAFVLVPLDQIAPSTARDMLSSLPRGDIDAILRVMPL